jgi:hypothetical protein
LLSKIQNGYASEIALSYVLSEKFGTVNFQILRKEIFERNNLVHDPALLGNYYPDEHQKYTCNRTSSVGALKMYLTDYQLQEVQLRGTGDWLSKIHCNI